MSKRIPLSQGKFAIVDDEDFAWLRQWKWYARKKGRTYYAARGISVKGKVQTIRMHREILKPASNMESDHINGDGLDNRRSNLRSCTHHENMRNRRKNIRDSSKYKGVFWDKESWKWRAGICVNGRTHNLGRFMEEERAAQAYNVAARQYHGEFARLNIIEKPRTRGLDVDARA